MNISIIGTGYVGLITGLCFAEMGNNVVCIDNDSIKIQRLNNLEAPIYEPGLEELLNINVTEGRIQFIDNIKEGISKSDICFIAVGTPPKEDGCADLSNVLHVADSIGRYIDHRLLVVNKSTVPVGTADLVRAAITSSMLVRNVYHEFDVVSNPEFLKEGSAIQDCMRPDRVIIGTENSISLELMKELYLPFIRNTENFITMDIRSAEMTKYVANAMLATKISFMNEMANICERIGADINKVRKGIGSDTRIGYNFIYAGCGYGGSCFPKDVQALTKMAQNEGFEPLILQAIDKVNRRQKYKLVEMITNRFGEDLCNLTFGVWGLSFKPDTTDMREASSITIISELVKLGAQIRAFDPKAMHEAKGFYLNDLNSIYYASSKYEALENANAMILITEWKEFRSPDFSKIKCLLKQPIIFDGRNQYDDHTLSQLGIEYYQIGVGKR